MIIFDHVRRIIVLSIKVLEWTDKNKYREAHHFLESIETRARLAHEELNLLQRQQSHSERFESEESP